MKNARMNATKKVEKEPVNDLSKRIVGILRTHKRNNFNTDEWSYYFGKIYEVFGLNGEYELKVPEVEEVEPYFKLSKLNSNFEKRHLDDVQGIYFINLYCEMIVKYNKDLGIDDEIVNILSFMLSPENYQDEFKKFLTTSARCLNRLVQVQNMISDMLEDIYDRYSDEIILYDCDEIYISEKENVDKIIHIFKQDFNLDNIVWDIVDCTGFFKKNKQFVINIGGKLFYRGIRQSTQLYIN